MELLSSFLACGIWPALPLTGYGLLQPVLRTHRIQPLPLITALALTSVAGIAVWSGVLLGAAIFGVYQAEYVGLLGWIISLLGLIRLILLKQPDLSRQIHLRMSAWDAILIAGLVLAAGLYLGFPTESIWGGRDQGVYASHGVYIAQHGRLDVPYPWPQDADSIFSEAFRGFPGFYRTQPFMTVQFAHLFPVWLAQAFSTFGPHGVFRLNAALALLSAGMFYGLCRSAIPKPYAVVATLFLALNPSQLWLARITLTEIFAQLFIISGLFMLLHALQDQNQNQDRDQNQDQDTGLARWAGVFLGCSALIRFDALLLVPLLLVLHLTWKWAEVPIPRKPVWSALYQGALPTFALAVGYYAVLSRPYFLDLSAHFRKLGFVCIVCVLALFATTPDILKRVRSWLSSQTLFRFISSVVLVLAIYAYWIRPVMEPYATIHWPGHLLDGVRDYREDSLVNLAHYLSPFVVWPAIFGWLIVWHRVAVGKTAFHLTAVLVIVGGFSALYLWNPSISPDHFWAIRRFVPVVIPGFIFFASVGIWSGLGKFSKGGALSIALPLLVFLLIFLIRADALLFTFAENKGLFEQLQQLAKSLPRGEIILAHDAGGWAAWTTPLYVAFDRQVVPLNVHTDEGKKAFDTWVTRQVAQQKPVYFLYEGESLFLCGFEANQLDKIILSRPYIEKTYTPLPRQIARERKPVILYKITGKDKEPDYRYVNLGGQVVLGVQQVGLGLQERTSNGQPIRWTNGKAKLVVPLNPQCLPKALKIYLASTGPKGTQLRVLVNGHALFNDHLPPGKWSNIFDLTDVRLDKRLTIELLSDTFVPREVIKDATDPRTLGVLVRDISLLG